jgi:hypothetical protein
MASTIRPLAEEEAGAFGKVSRRGPPERQLLGFAEQCSCGFQIRGVHEDLARAGCCEVLERRVDRIGTTVATLDRG